MKKIVEEVGSFLKENQASHKKILLALSGGPDSLALFYALLAQKESLSLQWGIAHVDHGWRNVSAQEALALKALARQWEIPFHCKTLNPQQMKGNLEAACREERLLFFKELCAREGYQAVLLAHHADDQQETVLKKILEGGSLPYLQGLQKISSVKGIWLWRPLLSFSKKEILAWLKNQGHEGFCDETNTDARFLRGRFRSQIFPYLQNSFGREIGESFLRIGEEAQELRECLNERIDPWLQKSQKSPMGIMLDLSSANLHPLEIRYLLRRFCEREGFCLGRSLATEGGRWLAEGKADVRLYRGSLRLYIDRKRLFLLTREFSPLPKDPFVLQEGDFSYGFWQGRLEKIQRDSIEEPLEQNDWKALWQGNLTVFLPCADYVFYAPSGGLLYPGSSPIRDWWNAHRTPAFLRRSVPLIKESGRVFHEFLTGKKREGLPKRGEVFRLSLHLL